MSLTRKPFFGIPALDEFLRSRAKMPFAWAKNDCALFAADAIEAITGTDIASEFRGKYTDEAGAWATVKQITGGTTVGDAAAYCARKVGLVELPHPLSAQRGDLVVIEGGAGLIAGVIGLRGFPVSPGVKGLKVFEPSAVKRAWRV